MLGGDGALVVDTRYTPAQAREVLDDLRELGSPRVGVVVNTHGHGDHCNGNSVFRPAPIWGHERCATMIRLTGEQQRLSGLAETPDVAGDLAEVVLDPPDHTFTDRATLDLDGRIVDLALPRARAHRQRHRDHDRRRRRAVRRRPARERRPALVRRRLPDGLAGDGASDPRPDRRADGRRSGSRRARRPGVRGAVARRDPRDRGPRDARPRGRPGPRGRGRRGALPAGRGPRGARTRRRAAQRRARPTPGARASPGPAPPSGRGRSPRRSRRAPARASRA